MPESSVALQVRAQQEVEAAAQVPHCPRPSGRSLMLRKLGGGAGAGQACKVQGRRCCRNGGVQCGRSRRDNAGGVQSKVPGLRECRCSESQRGPARPGLRTIFDVYLDAAASTVTQCPA